MSNEKLNKAKENKADEFYTQYNTVEKEIESYPKELFKDKTILCPCDSEDSNFTKYFRNNFENLGLKKLICTSYNQEYDPLDSFFNDYSGSLFVKTKDSEYSCKLKDNGDFNSYEVTKYLEESDIVITNPPFSLFRKFFKWIVSHNKDYIVLTNHNAISYTDVFPYFMNNKLFIGNTIRKGGTEFEIPYKAVSENAYEKDGKTYIGFSGITWFTSFKTETQHLELSKNYNQTDYPFYDYYTIRIGNKITEKVIEVPKSSDIPKNYKGYMGVPITFMYKYNPKQFKIYGLLNHSTVKNKSLFKRILIKKI